VLANITEFGKTPLLTAKELADAGVRMALYPLSAFRAMSKAAATVYSTIRRDGSQQAAVSAMQTREELYQVLDYHAYEQLLDQLYPKQV
jgi:methylisocitrate lyase